MFLRSLNVEKEDIILINKDETTINKELYNTEVWYNKYVIYSPSITIGSDFVPKIPLNIFELHKICRRT